MTCRLCSTSDVPIYDGKEDDAYIEVFRDGRELYFRRTYPDTSFNTSCVSITHCPYCGDPLPARYLGDKEAECDPGDATCGSCAYASDHMVQCSMRLGSFPANSRVCEVYKPSRDHECLEELRGEAKRLYDTLLDWYPLLSIQDMSNRMLLSTVKAKLESLGVDTDGGRS